MWIHHPHHRPHTCLRRSICNPRINADAWREYIFAQEAATEKRSDEIERTSSPPFRHRAVRQKFEKKKEKEKRNRQSTNLYVVVTLRCVCFSCIWKKLCYETNRSESNCIDSRNWLYSFRIFYLVYRYMTLLAVSECIYLPKLFATIVTIL